MTDSMVIPCRQGASASEAHARTSPPDICILSSCQFAAKGLTALLREKEGRSVRVQVVVPGNLATGSNTGLSPALPECGRLIAFIPWKAVEALPVLSMLASMLACAGGTASVRILSHFSPDWLYRTLLSLSELKILSAGVMATRANFPCPRLAAFISARTGSLSLREQAAEEERHTGNRAKGLTRCELEAVQDYLSGRQTSSRAGASPKTRNIQRLAGLRKLLIQLPAMSEHLPGRHRIRPRQAEDAGMVCSPDEQAFRQAIHDGQVLPVFQPVVDRNMQVRGFEVLTRWLRNGRMIPPAEFLPLIRTRETWLLLTAFVMNVAVQRINQFGGKLYFTVNIPPCVTESGALRRMAETARGKLTNPDWVDRLVPEFAETTDLSRNEPALSALRGMMESGYRIFLDDCFSAGSVMFPVRQLQFSGYKLDMALVNAFQENLHDENLIRGLVYYCRLTGSQCIAEGVDTREKFRALADIGVDSFQGFYIAPPVPAEELEYTVGRLGGL